MSNTIEIKTITECEFDDRLAQALQRAVNDGWGILGPPTLARVGEPRGMNGYAVGFGLPHYLVILKRTRRPDVEVSA